jgi:hypothetical protein
VSYFGTILDVQDGTSKDGTKHWVDVNIDTELKGATEFRLWDTVFAGKPGQDGEEPLCDVHQMIGQRVIFDCQPGKPRLDKDGNETGEHWPATLTMIGPAEETVNAPPLGSKDPARDLDGEAVMILVEGMRSAAHAMLGAADVAAKVLKGC